TAEGVAAVVFTRYFDTSDKRMGNAAGVEPPRQVGLVDQQLGAVVTPVALRPGGAVGASRHADGVHMRSGDDRQPFGFGIAGEVAEADAIAEVMIQAYGERLDIGFLGVDIAKAEESISVDT